LDQAYDFGGAGLGRTITADAGAVQITSPTASGTALVVNTNGTDEIGIDVNLNNGGAGVRSRSTLAANGFPSVQAETNSTNNLNTAILGNTTGAAYGIAGQAIYPLLQLPFLATTSELPLEVLVCSAEVLTGFPEAVFMRQEQEFYEAGTGVYGINTATALTADAIGVGGEGFVGVGGAPLTPLGFGVVSYGDFLATGDLFAVGVKTFAIDHPSDPANKMLRHAAVESDEVLNIYRGNVVCDASGNAIITLPSYFAAINKDFSYILTPVGAAAPELHVKTEIIGDSFTIAGGKPNMKISWQVTAERNDIYMQENPFQPEQMKLEQKKGTKLEQKKGTYLYPEGYGQSEDKAYLKKPVREKPAAQQELNLNKTR